MERKLSFRSRVGVLMAAVAACGIAASTASAAAPPGYVDASTYGGGYNATDATSALHAAINSGQNVYVPNMGTPWIITPLVLSQSNQTILFESGTVVQAKSGAFTGTTDSLFWIVGQSNVTLSGYGATLRMNQSDYTQGPYTASESRMGIKAYSVNNFQVKGLTIENTGGDGIYLGAYPTTTPNTNVSIKDVTLNNNYRNGISVISADGLTIDNATVRNTNGTAPKAGIDFEPNSAGQVLKNITVKNSIINSNGGHGIMFDLNLGGSPTGTTASIENVTIFGNGVDGINLRETLPGLTIKDSLIVQNGRFGNYGYLKTGSTKNSVDYSAILNNGSGAFHSNGNMILGTGSLTSLSGPLFYSIDPNSPDFMYLDPGVSNAIALGASDGSYMGARPVYGTVVPEPTGMALILAGGGMVLMGRRSRAASADGLKN